MNFRKLFNTLHSADLVIIAFFGLLSLLNGIFADRIPGWWVMILINIVLITGICFLALARASSNLKLLAYLHDWYVAPLVFFTFKELYFMIKPIHQGNDYDDWLIAADQWMFGVNPTEWLMQFSTPWVTEVLQIAYTLFYVLFLVIGYELYRRHSRGVFHFFMFTCVYGFYLSYLGYFTLPAVGPRFTLHDFNSLDTDLPGILLTPYLRWFVNAGESVPMGVSSAEAMAGAQRDVFPSGHTMMTLVLMALGERYRLASRHFVLVTGILLIIATVYQRYHYVVDLFAGALFAMVCVYTAPRLYQYLHDNVQTRDRLHPWTPKDR